MDSEEEASGFERAALEERELERGAEDIEDAEFQPRDDPDGSADTPGSLADFVEEGGDVEARSWEAVGRMREAFPSDDEIELPEHLRAAKRRRTLGEDAGPEEASRELTPIRTRAPSPERSREAAGSFGGGSSARSTPSVPRGASDLPFEAEMDEVVAMLPAPPVLAKVPSREEQHRVFVLMWGLRKAVLQYKARVGRSVDDLCGFRGSSTSGFLTAVRRLSRALPERALRKYEGVSEEEGQGRRQRKESGRLLLLTYLQSQFFVSGYRYRDDACWKKRGSTASWERVCTVKEFVFHACTSWEAPEKISMVFNLKDQDWNVGRYFIDNRVDVTLPSLAPSSRYLFSFRNGVYVALVSTTILNPEYVDLERGAYDTFVRKADMARMLRPTVIACNYFDRDFDVADYERCRDMSPAELIESSQESLLRMLKSQRMSSTVLVIFYAFVGRLLGEIRDDNWEKLFYVVGQAGSGKSTLLESILAKFYADHDVCNTGSDTEKTFGMQAFVGKKLVLLDETAKKLGISQQAMQSWIAGQSVPINRKYMEAIEARLPPLVASGNETMAYDNNQGSQKRRVCIFDFPVKIRSPDPAMRDKIEGDRDKLLYKPRLVYLHALREHDGAFPLSWNAYFDATYLKHATASMDKDVVALLSERADSSPGDFHVYCPLATLMADFKDQTKKKRAKIKAYVLENFDVTPSVRLPYPRKSGQAPVADAYVLGIDLKDRGEELFRLRDPECVRELGEKTGKVMEFDGPARDALGIDVCKMAELRRDPSGDRVLKRCIALDRLVGLWNGALATRVDSVSILKHPVMREFPSSYLDMGDGPRWYVFGVRERGRRDLDRAYVELARIALERECVEDA
ncbi:hypothetical protein KFL_002190580 [Klebsormidium nitens]|uniref:SF3 helicase domain-containing protein n=1 Tax=Klebsormidium nitens TaxID=105231 RepID=A0A1Y1I8T7_KLENI|nr:hypothetical protein KFL_002190580 [Klebsormidium nitens]|eukprot:GAQ85106.1 hypothetical protein KFL_002190580 [Klebsormidium nitens]